MRVLVVEDDHTVRNALAVALRTQGMHCHAVPDGRAAIAALQAMSYDVVLLDLGLPDVDGINLLPGLRHGHAGPILVISARRDQSDKVAALDAGADDYLTKPFGLDELLARIRAVSRRAGVGQVVNTPVFSVDLALEVVVDRAGGPVDLSQTEWAVLAALARAGGTPVTAEQLLEQVWSDTSGNHLNYARVYINLLRRKLEPDPAHPVALRNRPGRGYWLELSP